jgi:drug/metabolite transporter (DMT)-like permease
LIAVSKGGVEFRGAALLVLAAAVVQGVYHTAQKPLLGRYTGFEVTVYAMWSGTLLVLPWSGALVRSLPHASAGAIGAAVFLGVAPSAIGFLTWAYGVARVEISEATAGLYLVPVVAIVSAYLWLGEVPGLLAIVGGAVALLGVVAAGAGQRTGERSGERRRRERPGRVHEVAVGRHPEVVRRHAPAGGEQRGGGRMR